MKRWLLLVSRTGTVLLAVGLALLLVSTIPPARMGGFSSGADIPPGAIQVFGPYIPPFASSNVTLHSSFSSILTPQQELQIDLACNGTLEVYLLKADAQSYMESLSGRNADALNEYLQAHDGIVAWQGQIEQTGTIDYIPTEVVNASIVALNPSQNYVRMSYEGSILSLVGPADKAQTIALFALPIGLVLALPMLLGLRKTR